MTASENIFPMYSFAYFVCESGVLTEITSKMPPRRAVICMTKLFGVRYIIPRSFQLSAIRGSGTLESSSR